jgi:hypothetical protein
MFSIRGGSSGALYIADRQLEDNWKTIGTQVEDKWKTSGRQVEDKWKTSGRQVEDKWKTSGRQVKDKWKTSGRQVASYLEGVLGELGGTVLGGQASGLVVRLAVVEGGVIWNVAHVHTVARRLVLLRSTTNETNMNTQYMNKTESK